MSKSDISDGTTALLGPKGTNSHLALTKMNDSFYKQADPKGSGLLASFKEGIQAVFQAVITGETQYGLIPIENQLTGTLPQNLDSIRSNNLWINKEVVIPIEFTLCSLDKNVRPSKIFSHPQAFLQCSEFLKLNYSEAELVSTTSTAEAAQIVASQSNPGFAAISPEHAVWLHNLEILSAGIHDYVDNATRFFLVTQKPKKHTFEGEKTSIVFSCQHQVGTLYDCLGVFDKNGINLTKLESRPIPEEDWEYYFYLDFDSNQPKADIERALVALEKQTISCQVLGQYNVIS